MNKAVPITAKNLEMKMLGERTLIVFLLFEGLGLAAVFLKSRPIDLTSKND